LFEQAASSEEIGDIERRRESLIRIEEEVAVDEEV
jgi:hypothetical protein